MIAGTYNAGLVFLSVLIAMVASYAAFNLGERVSAYGDRRRWLWLAGGAIAMGIGIWSMHYVGMLAFVLPVPVLNHVPTVILSLIAAVAGAAVALYIASKKTMRLVNATIGGVFLGGAIASMHYIGMAAMRSAAMHHYDAGLVILSIVVAITFSCLAVWLGFTFSRSHQTFTWTKLVAASFMGAGIASMHYIAMAAARFMLGSAPLTRHTVEVSALGAFGIGMTTLLLLATVLVTSWFDRLAANERLLRRLYGDLEEREAKIRRMVEANIIGIFIWELEGRILEANDAFLCITGYDRHDLASGRVRWTDLTPPEWLDLERRQYLPELKKTGSLQPFEKEYFRKDGSRVPVLIGVANFDEAGNQGVGFVLDLSERKRAEEALQRSEAYLAEAQRVSHTGSFGWHVSSGELFWSEETFQIFHYDQATKPAVELVLQRVHPEDAARVNQTLERASQDGKDFEHEYRLLMPDGSIKYIHAVAHASQDRSGGIEFVGAVSDVTVKNRAEEDLRKSEERWRSVFENSAVGVALTDMDGYFIATNHVYQTMVGYTEEELCGLRFLDITHEDYREVNWALITELVEGRRRQFQIEKQYRRKDGSLIWVRNNDSLVPGTERIPRFIMALSEDITQRKRAEEALQRSEGYLAEAEKLSHTGTWAVHVPREAAQIPQLEMVYWSEEMYRIFSIDPSPRPPSHLERARRLHPEDVDRHHAIVSQAILDRTDFDTDYRLLLPNGATKYIRAVGHPVLNASGEVIELVGTAMDVTEQHEARAALQRAFDQIEAEKTELRRTIDAIPTFVVVLNPDGRVIYGNQTSIDYTGVTPEDVQREGHREPRHPEDVERLREERLKALAGDMPFENEQRLRGKDGKYRWFLIRYNPLRDDQGKVVRWYTTATDIDDRKRAEEALQRSESYLAEGQRLARTGSWAYDPNADRPIYWSEEMRRMFGLDPQGNNLPDAEEYFRLTHPNDRDTFRELMYKAFREKADLALNHRIVLPDGTVKHIHAIGHPVLDESGNVVEYVGTDVDVTEQHEARAALQRAFEQIKAEETELRRMIDAIATGVYVLRPDGTVLHANQAVLDYTGLTLEDLNREDLRTRVIHPEDVEKLRGKRQDTFARGVPFENEQRALGKDGRYRWFLVGYNPLRDDQGNIIRWYATATDIDDRKRAEERMRDENLALREQIDQAFMFEEIVGSSAALQTVLSGLVKVAPTDSTVLITGETGTGKELIARAIHKRSQRAGQPFISVNCASIPSSLIASELFGHEKGAFTGAVQRRQGRFELAHSGTIFLDEVGDLPLETQVTLLRVLQERQFERVGGNRILTTDVRVIAATNRDLSVAIAEGTFRSDLFYRLNVFPIEVPPLRKRKEDIPILVEYFVKRYAEKAGKQIRKIDRNTLELCQSYSWPGNIRELQNIVERSVILSSGDAFGIEKAWLASPEPARQELQNPLPDALQNQERRMIEAALAECKGKVAGPEGAAAKLGIPRSTLDWKIKQLKIKKH
jgi:PAS domain S-box-containing protein